MRGHQRSQSLIDGQAFWPPSGRIHALGGLTEHEVGLAQLSKAVARKCQRAASETMSTPPVSTNQVGGARAMHMNEVAAVGEGPGNAQT